MYVHEYNKGFSFFSETKFGSNQSKPEFTVDLKGATIEMASKDKSSKKNVFEVINYCLSIILILNLSNFMFCLSYWGNCLSVWLVKAELVIKSVCIWLLSQKSWCKDLASFAWVIRSQTLYYKPLFQVLHFPNNNKRCGSLYPQNPILKSKLKPSQCHKKLPTVTHTYCCLTDHPKLSSPRKDARCLLS